MQNIIRSTILVLSLQKQRGKQKGAILTSKLDSNQDGRVATTTVFSFTQDQIKANYCS